MFFTTDEAAYTIFAPTDRALSALPQDKQQDPKFLNGNQILITYFVIKFLTMIISKNINYNRLITFIILTFSSIYAENQLSLSHTENSQKRNCFPL